MRKEEAAKFLGVSVRTLELYTQQSRIGGHYEKGKTRPVLVYDEAEVKRFKAELEGQNYPHRPVVEHGARDAGRAPRRQAAAGFTDNPVSSAFSDNAFSDNAAYNPTSGQNGSA